MKQLSRRARKSLRVAATAEVEEAEEGEEPDFRLPPELLDQLLPSTLPTPRLTPQEVLDAFYGSVHPVAKAHYASFFSSELRGIVTDPALMLLHPDDHMVHRGHGVFDTCTMVDGHLYLLDRHLNRFFHSSVSAAIPLPYTMAQLKRIILETAAASCKLNGTVRFWLSAGRGGFGLSSSECGDSALYVMVTTGPVAEADYVAGWRVKTTLVPIKDPYFATIKSTNYLPNVLAALDAEADEFDQGIFVDEEGHVAEGPNLNVAIVTPDGLLVIPPFTQSLDGITVQRLLELLPKYIESEEIDGLIGFDQRPFTVDEAKRAQEVFLVSSSVLLAPVVQWDDSPIGEGRTGPIALACRTILMQDLAPRPDSDAHEEVPYGYMTDMEPPQEQ